MLKNRPLHVYHKPLIQFYKEAGCICLLSWKNAAKDYFTEYNLSNLDTL
jgi:hypothetical protein